MRYEIITESNLAIGIFKTKEEAIEKAADLGLGDQRDDADAGWMLGVVRDSETPQ